LKESFDRGDDVDLEVLHGDGAVAVFPIVHKDHQSTHEAQHGRHGGRRQHSRRASQTIFTRAAVTAIAKQRCVRDCCRFVFWMCF
jgi:hypothetical protein